jgi:hypothetical protein
MRNTFRLVGKHVGKRSLGRPRRRSENYIKIYLRQIGWKELGNAFFWLWIGTNGGLL